MNKAPVLILAYNRADKVANLIDSLRPLRPSTVLVGVDGPRFNKPNDVEKVAEVHKVLESINWTNDVQILGREKNLGLKRAVIDSVDWAIDAYGKAIVIEEDVIVGSQFLDFMNAMLYSYKDDEQVAHISGYNIVPEKKLSTDKLRLTRYPESIAWATWSRAWKNFDESLTWGTHCNLEDIRKIVGSNIGALKWRMNFNDAQSDRISTWAYRWIASIWSKNQFVVSPNLNLVNYSGFDSGSHTITAAPWKELTISNYKDFDFIDGSPLELDLRADGWLAKEVFGESVLGLAKNLTITAIRKFIPERH